MWPAARFDLLATLLSLTAIIFSLDYLRRGGLLLIGAALSLIAALLNKEIGYAVPLIVAALSFSDAPARRSKRAVRLLAILFGISLAMIAVRVLVYGGLGGYPGANGQASPNFAVGWISGIPVMNLIGWQGPTGLNGRYLYFPAC